MTIDDEVRRLAGELQAAGRPEGARLLAALPAMTEEQKARALERLRKVEGTEAPTDKQREWAELLLWMTETESLCWRNASDDLKTAHERYKRLDAALVQMAKGRRGRGDPPARGVGLPPEWLNGHQPSPRYWEAVERLKPQWAEEWRAAMGTSVGLPVYPPPLEDGPPYSMGSYVWDQWELGFRKLAAEDRAALQELSRKVWQASWEAHFGPTKGEVPRSWIDPLPRREWSHVEPSPAKGEAVRSPMLPPRTDL